MRAIPNLPWTALPPTVGLSGKPGQLQTSPRRAAIGWIDLRRPSSINPLRSVPMAAGWPLLAGTLGSGRWRTPLMDSPGQLSAYLLLTTDVAADHEQMLLDTFAALGVRVTPRVIPPRRGVDQAQWLVLAMLP